MTTKKKAKGASKRASKAAPARAAAPAAPAVVNAFINGQASGTVTPGELTIQEAAGQIARDHGLKAYSILVDNVKVTQDQGSRKLAGAKSIEVFAKETRG